ncbi:MAG: hypothetical protein CFE43_16820 [Burkholderiales bacterium PBB3]|nr:MAG: hypothetical protein CFE43_16820 [Burkholderiales bacterium PBB3]
MQLAELIAQECQVPLAAIMLLRHSNANVQDLRRHGVSVEEYTAIQPIESKYDFFHPHKERIHIVVVIVDDLIFRPFRVTGIEAEGTEFSIGSEAFRRFKSEENSKPWLCRRFSLQPLPSTAIGLRIRGWELSRTRTPVQRLGSAFFNEIAVGISASAESLSEQVRT